MRPHVLLSLLALPVALVAACASSPDQIDKPTPDGPVTAEEQFFNANLKPTFEANCANCHAKADDSYGAPDFLGSGDPAAYYRTIRDWGNFVRCDVMNSELIGKGADPTHPGASFATADAPNVQQWLEMEAIVEFGELCDDETPIGTTTGGGSGQGGSGQGGDGAGGAPVNPNWPPTSAMQHLKAFSDCSSYTDWVEAQMPQVAQQQAQFQGNNTQCYNCHNLKNTGLNHMPDPNNTAAVMDAFMNMRYIYANFNLVRWTVDENNQFLDIVQSYRWKDKGLGTLGHPTYELNATRQGYIDDWFQRTYLKYQNALATNTPCDAAAGNPQ